MNRNDETISGIQGKVIAITGASGGIGEAAAVRLAECGAKLVIGARSTDRLKDIVTRIESRGGEAVYASMDVTSREDLSHLVQLACERYGKLDVLINNAGIGPISPLDELRVEDWEATIDVNTKGVLYGIAAALPVFRQQNFGHFVNIASTAGLKTVVNQAVYSGSKFAVRAISEGLRQEAGDHIRVTIISPGVVQTNFIDGIPNQQVRDQLAAVRDGLGLPPEAVARAIAFAIEQPDDVDINEIVIRPTAQV
ncbi:SDR family oxidoreductase [Paenibacillus sp. VCA1]|uniref:SDR family oxidoreductase n=1 Tax=Paenibacillus sp. VCA1 TaxID=3039148 RepID=UPI0028718CE2|nr:SDR family oxidoreductase [Paenibacillus sp. VCA1]MDR9855746.1 SDR family oxidoreductase [Paenibacillus sp. VCA1]